MAHVILGLLLIAPQSLYGLIKAFEAGVSLFYSASSGSIKRALDALLEGGQIEVESAEQQGRRRKVYRVTEAGRTEFHSWMTAELTASDLETAALSRLFFLGLLDAAERPDVLRRIEVRLESDLASLEALNERLDTQDVPDGYEDVAAYHRATLDYGLASNRFALDWFQDRIARLEASESTS